MIEFKNRFKMFKEPLHTTLFEAVFDKLNVSGISFEGQTNSQPTQRTFCSCGFSDKVIHHKCPQCGKQILNLGRRWGDGNTHYGTFYDIILLGGKYSVSKVEISIDAPQATKWFEIKSERTEVGSICQTPNGPLFTLASGYSARHVPRGTPRNEFSSGNTCFGFSAGAIQLLKDMYDDAGIVLGNIAKLFSEGNAATSCAAINAMYYLPLVFNDSNYASMPHTLEVLLKCDWIANMCQTVPKCPFPNAHRYHWSGGLSAPKRTLNLDDVLWISGVIPEIGNIENYSKSHYAMGMDWSSSLSSEIEELVAQRDFLCKTAIGKYLIHRYQTGNISTSDFEEWLDGWPKFSPELIGDELDLFYSWYKERIDIISNRISFAIPSFKKCVNQLRTFGYFPDEDLLRQRKYNTIVNQAKYQTEDFVDMDAGMKNPTQLIIDMGNATRKAVDC